MEEIKEYILHGKITEPVVFRKIHTSWLPLSWTNDEWEKILFSRSNFLCARAGKVGVKEIQWESDCVNVDVSWETFTRWDVDSFHTTDNVTSSDHWLYYDYKYMSQCLPPEILGKFNWSELGFPERDGKDTTLWIGTRGAYTPCHFDTYGCNLVCQIRGRKRWILFSPEDTKHLRPTRVPYEESSVYSQINLENPSASDYEKLKQCHAYEIILEPGDVLFVPCKWWHFVKSQEFSISVNTWIEMPSDSYARLEESIVRVLTHCVANSASPTIGLDLLNPNEMELLHLTESDLIQMLLNSSLEVQRLHDFKVPSVVDTTNGQEEPPEKLRCCSDTRPPPTLEWLQRLVPCAEKLKVTKLVHTFDASNKNSMENNSAQNKCLQEREVFRHFLNAVGHPDILKQIREKFMENISERR